MFKSKRFLSLFLAALLITSLTSNALKEEVKEPAKIIKTLIHGTHAIQGRRPTMEDEHYPHEGGTEIKVKNEIKTAIHQGSVFLTAPTINKFFGIYDGHGGKSAAQYVKKHLHINIIFNEHFATNVQKAIQAGFKKTDKDFTGDFQCGTTVTTAFINDNTLYVAHAGDGRAVLSVNKTVALATKDHKPDNPEEQKRIEAAGGEVEMIFGIARVDGNLAVSRAIGDKYYKRNGKLKVT